MSNSMRDLIDGEAELDDEEDDESFDGEGGDRASKRPPQVDDSSEEEDDDDEEEARRIRENFIVDEEEEEEDAEDDEAERKRRRKRRRAEREEEAQLDDEDLDLIGESRPDWERKPESQPKFKRLKQGHREDDARADNRRDLTQIFSDDEDEQEDRHFNRPSRHGPADEFDDFIEDDYPEDEDERNQRQEDMEVARPRDRGVVVDTSGLDKEALDDFEAIFGHGEDYEWALQAEEDEQERQREEENLEIKDIFEPAQLQDKLLTDEDNEIRFTDEPERFQLERRPFKDLQLTPEQFKEEARWISKMIWPKKQLGLDFRPPFNKAVAKVLEFFVVDEVEVPFVFSHRKDYIIYMQRQEYERNASDSDGAPEKLLLQDDLWRILELDIKFRSLIEKRNVLEKTYKNLKTSAGVSDPIFDEMVFKAETMEELQDVHDYMQFQYASQMKELAAAGAITKEVRRPGAKSTSGFERIRNANAYNFVKAYGIPPDRLAQNALREGKKVIPEDPEKLPIELADSLCDSYFDTGDGVMNAARNMYAEELYQNPRMRRHFRVAYYAMGSVSCRRTEKGLRRIDESHPFYEIKYLLDQTIEDLVGRPEVFLKMMKAEEEGLVEVKLTLHQEREFRKNLLAEFQSDNFSERADAWNEERRKALDVAFPKLEKIIAKGVKDSLRTACQEDLLQICRTEFFRRIDQAPYKPKGLVLGTTPRCLVISNGMADPNRDLLCWAYVEENDRVMEQGKFGSLGRDEAARNAFCELVERRRPDVIGVSGWSADTNRLVRDLETLINDRGLMGNEFEDPETEEVRTELLEVLVVNDEVARLYKDSPRAVADHPTLNPVTRYCIALGRYLQNPLKEYANLGKDITSLAIHPCQNLLPQDKLFKVFETALVDVVNLVGVDINEAVNDPYTATLLPYVAGLGPRKATAVIKAIHKNGGIVSSRAELVGDPDRGKVPVVGPHVWNNCVSSLIIDYDATNEASDPLDSTRVHPEDYELGRKMAADALELDEEDVRTAVEDNGPGAVVRMLFKEDSQEKVNELVLEEYAEQLEAKYHQRKRATLYTIRSELLGPYEELRRHFITLSPDEIFTMFTGETKDSLCKGMIVPINVRVVKEEFAIVKLDCGIEGRIEAHEVSTRHSVREILQVGQTTRAKVLDISRKDFMCRLSVREDMLQVPFRRHQDYNSRNWDFRLETQDTEDMTEKDNGTGRAQRVIKHPMFKPFNSTQAEEYLGSQPSGEVVVRSSSKGNDHLAVTWKVADNVYQHVDVLELDKENEFSVGRTLKVANKYTYSDLDELIVDHIKAMSKKVDELMRHEKFQKGSRSDLERWLTTYMDANPNRSTYAFCLDTKHPGYFVLCFKASRSSRIGSWSVRVIPQAFEMMGNQYPDVRALCNGFKLRWQSEQLKMSSMPHRGGR
ncbi:transcription elongation factor SPT6 [Gaeumannomyces tritici R3-111a-1]|uniref:Transcription elongation factor Spt6 n=1 Tax=Gaeumannomyces tritici (strain R3-111a-1) TaxID=644352 RepID=J3NGN7_GAET3|nr:transcription elongation factor SPT6 [Gaeumannomyces tritici R3-111a-1]EJT80427.1 transcription elongation factor SPT6 [Gaeumannomyces tritici R3-111a-1]